MVKKNIKKFLNFFYQLIFNKKIDKKLGNIFYKNENLFSYNLFNTLYLKKISKNEKKDEFIDIYKNEGFSESKKISDNKIDAINLELSKQNSNNDGTNRYFYKMTDDIIFNIKNILNDDLKEPIDKLQKFYNSKLCVTNAVIFKYFGYDSGIDKRNDYQLYHNDQYIFTYFRLFINLEDIDESKGPLHIFSVKNSLKFSEKHKYKSRFSYTKPGDMEIDKLAFKNVGKKGKTLFFNTSRCLHRGGIPKKGKTRTMLCVLFNAIPSNNFNENNIFEFENNPDTDIWSSDALSKKFGEPKNILSLYNLYKNFQNGARIK